MSQQPPGLPPLDGFPNAPHIAPDPPTGRQGDDKPPAELRRVVVIQTFTAAILVFVGVFYITQIKEMTQQLLSPLSSAQVSVLQDVSKSQLQTLLYVVAGLLIVFGLLHGVAAHGLRNGKAWARPVGYIAGGIIIAFTIMGLISGAISLPSILLGVLSVCAVILLSRSTVRSYLSSNKK